MKILLTTTSFADTPGAHHDVLKHSGFEIVTARGPLSESQMLEQMKGGVDGLLNGDDQITAKVIDAALPRLKVIAKYGIGLDSIDVKHPTARRTKNARRRSSSNAPGPMRWTGEILPGAARNHQT